MSKTNENRPPRSLPARFVKSVLDFTNLVDTVEVRDCVTHAKWYVDFALVNTLLFSSYKDRQGKEPLIDEACDPEELLAEPGKTERFCGYFPYDQIILQRMGVEYIIWCDGTARQRIVFNNQVHYLCIVSENSYPVEWCKRGGAFAEQHSSDPLDCSWLYQSLDWHTPYNDCSDDAGDVDDVELATG